MALADRAELAVRLTLDDRSFTGPLRRVQGNLGRLDRATTNTQRALGRTAGALQRTAVIAAAAATGGFLFAVHAAGDFEDAFAGVVKTVGGETGPGTELEKLRLEIRQMALDIPITANELAALGETAGALGIPVDKIGEAIKTAALLGVTTDVSAETAITSLGILGNVLHFTADDYDNFGSALVQLGNTGASFESQILDIATRVGGVARTFGLANDEVLGLSNAAASFAGLNPEAAGSSLIRLMQGLTRVVAKGGGDFELLNKIVGTDFKKAIETDASDALVLFLKSMGKLDRFEKIKVLDELGIKGVFLAQLLEGLSGNIDGVTFSFDTAANAWRENIALSEEAQRKFDTINSQFQIMQNQIYEVGITIGEKLAVKIKPLLEEFGTFIANNGPAIEKFGDQVADAFVGIIQAARNLPWDAIINGLRTAAGVALGAIKIFTSLPKEVQGLLIGGFVANKITGGLVTGIGKDIAGLGLGAIFKTGIFARGSSPANPVFVSAIGGGLGPGAVGAVAGGAGLLAAGAIATVAAIGATAAIQSMENTATAQAIQARQAEVLPTASPADLRTQLAAIDRGIFDITHTPLHFFVQGEALTHLQAMRAAAVAQLAKATGQDHAGYLTAQAAQNLVRQQTDSKIIAAAGARTALEQRTRLDAIYNKLESVRLGLLTQPLGPPINVNTTVNVSTYVAPGKVSNAIKTYQTWSGGRALNKLGQQ